MVDDVLHIKRRAATATVTGAREAIHRTGHVVALSDGLFVLDANSTLSRLSLDGACAPSTTLRSLRAPATGLATSADRVLVWGASNLVALDAETLAEVATLTEPLGAIHDAASLGGSLVAAVVAGGRAARVRS